jgi:hypothetical protein
MHPCKFLRNKIKDFQLENRNARKYSTVLPYVVMAGKTRGKTVLAFLAKAEKRGKILYLHIW